MRSTIRLSIAALFITSAVSFGASEPLRIVVLPFSSSLTHESDAIAAGVQSSLVADLPHAIPGRADEVSLDPAAAVLRIVHSTGARYVVMGQIQRVDSSLRLTAQLFDANGNAVNSVKETGDAHDLFDLEDKLAFDLRDGIRTVEQSHRAITPMPAIASAGPLRFSPQPPLPVGTVAVTYTSQRLREGNQRNIYNTPFYEYDGFGFGYGYGFGGFGGFGLGGFGFGSNTVGFATGGAGQGAY